MPEAPTSDIQDEVLAEAVQHGDTTSFNELMRRYEPKLFRYGLRFLARSEDIEDTVQDVFLKAYENIRSFDRTQRFSPWIYRIAHNAFVNVLRKNAKRSFAFFDFDTLAAPLSLTETEETEPQKTELRSLIERVLSEIDLKYREVLVLYYFEEMSYDEIADILRIPKGTVGIRLKRGREALRQRARELGLQHYGT